MSKLHLSSADALPSLRKDTLYIYGRRYCPFVHAVYLVLHHKNIPYEVININTKDKPTWYIQKNPNQKVPALEINDKVLYESAAIMGYLDEEFPGPKLTPTDPYIKAKGRILFEEFKKVRGCVHKAFIWSSEDERKATMEAFYTEMEKFENYMPPTKFLCGEEVSLADYACWPGLERLRELKPRFGVEALPPGRYHKVRAWIAAMEETPGARATKIKLEEMLAYREQLQLLGNKFDYDFATKK